MDTFINFVSELSITFGNIALWGLLIFGVLLLIGEARLFFKGKWELKKWFTHRVILSRLATGAVLIVVSTVIMFFLFDLPIPN